MDKFTKEKLDGQHFYKLFKHHFADFPIPLSDLGITPQNLDYDFGLYKAIIKTVNYYLGLIDNEARDTGVYLGPVLYHEHKIMSIMNSLKIERLINNTTLNMRDWQARAFSYKFISHLGLA